MIGLLLYSLIWSILIDVLPDHLAPADPCTVLEHLPIPDEWETYLLQQSRADNCLWYFWLLLPCQEPSEPAENWPSQNIPDQPAASARA